MPLKPMPPKTEDRDPPRWRGPVAAVVAAAGVSFAVGLIGPERRFETEYLVHPAPGAAPADSRPAADQLAGVGRSVEVVGWSDDGASLRIRCPGDATTSVTPARRFAERLAVRLAPALPATEADRRERLHVVDTKIADFTRRPAELGDEPAARAARSAALLAERTRLLSGDPTSGVSPPRLELLEQHDVTPAYTAAELAPLVLLVVLASAVVVMGRRRRRPIADAGSSLAMPVRVLTALHERAA